MRKILFILFMLPFVLKAQTKTVIRLGSGNQVTVYASTGADSLMYTPSGCGLPTINMTPYVTKYRHSAFYVDTCNDLAYFYSPGMNAWNVLSPGTPVISGGTFYQFQDSTNTPPVSFPAGIDTVYYMVGGAGTGIFSGNNYKIAMYVSGVFDSYITRVTGDLGLVLTGTAANTWHEYNGATWPRRNSFSWNTNGNKGGGILGSTDNNDVFLQRNGANRIRLTTSGTVFPQLNGSNNALAQFNSTGLLLRTEPSSSTDTSTYKPIGWSSTGAIVRMPTWGITSQNFSNANLTLTADRTHSFNSHTMLWSNVGGFQIQTIQADIGGGNLYSTLYDNNFAGFNYEVDKSDLSEIYGQVSDPLTGNYSYRKLYGFTQYTGYLFNSFSLPNSSVLIARNTGGSKLYGYVVDTTGSKILTDSTDSPVGMFGYDLNGRVHKYAVPGGSGGPVTSVSGTANQIASTGGTTPVLSLVTNPILPGAPTIASPGNSTQNIITTDATQTLSNKTVLGLTIEDATNIVLNTTTGTKIGTGTTQKLSFYNSTPIAQPTGAILTALQNLGLVASASIAESAITFTDITTNNASSSAHGYLPKLPNTSTTVLDGTGAFVDKRPVSGSVSGSDVITTSATAVDITNMIGAVDANKRYRLTATMFIGCNNTGGVRFTASAPSGTAILSGILSGSAATAAAAALNRLTTFGTLTGSGATYNRANLATGMVTWIVYFTTSSTAGNIQLQFASGNSGETSTVFVGSTMDIVEIQSFNWWVIVIMISFLIRPIYKRQLLVQNFYRQAA